MTERIGEDQSGTGGLVRHGVNSEAPKFSTFKGRITPTAFTSCVPRTLGCSKPRNLFRGFLTELCIVWLLSLMGTARADAVDDYLRMAMMKRHIPGLSVAVVQNGYIVKSQGYGVADRDAKIPATPETVYELASLTKQFTAAAIAKLAQDGKLDPADKISRYLPDTPDLWANITVRQLLNQTSGLPNFLEGLSVKALRRDYTAAEVVQRIAARPLLFVPGTQYAYSNTNYYLLGIIIEKVSGKSYREYLQDTFFTPLGMTQTRFYDPKVAAPKTAQGSLWDGHSLRRSPFVYSPTLQFGFSGILSTTGNLVKWNAALDGDTLLTPTSKSLLWSPPLLPNGARTDYASGWLATTVYGHQLLWHNGALPTGFTSAFFKFPDDKLTLIVLSNHFDISGQQSTPLYALTLGLAKLYLPALQDAPLPVDPDPKLTALLRSRIAALAAGKIDRSQFTPEMNTVLTPAVLQQNKQTFSAFGPLQSLAFLQRFEANGLQVSRYRAVFGETPIVWTLALTPEGKIAGVESGA